MATNIFPTDYTTKWTPDWNDVVWSSDAVTNFNLTVASIALYTLTNNDTDDLSEWSTNLYYTEARVTANTTVVALWNDKADKSNVLELNNTTAFTPAADYEPATKAYVDDSISSIAMKFWWDWTDWALDTSSWTVNIDCWGATLVEKNYTSINVATNNLTFSNPNTDGTIVIIKSKWNVTISATIDISWMGWAGWLWGVFWWADATSGTVWINIEDSSTNWILWGNWATNNAASAWWAWGAIFSDTYVTNSLLRLSEKRIRLFAWSGGWGWGKSTHVNWGNWGNWGWGFYIECAWSIDFSWTINANWWDWINGTDEVTFYAWGGWGWGWWAWSVIVLYNSLTANTWTINTNSWTWWDWGAGKTYAWAWDTESGWSGWWAGWWFASAWWAGWLGSNWTNWTNWTNWSGAWWAGWGARWLVSTTSWGTGWTAVSNPTHKLITKNTVFS